MIIIIINNLILKWAKEFPGSPAVRTPHCHCRGLGFGPWSEN